MCYKFWCAYCTRGSANFGLKIFSPQVWGNQIEPAGNPDRRTATKQVVYIDGIIQTFLRICDIHGGRWFGVYFNLEVYVSFGDVL